MGTNILDDLRRNARSLIQQGDWSRVRYALFFRSGFTPALEAQAGEEGVLLIGLEALLSPVE